jgi:hypothetical protein
MIPQGAKITEGGKALKYAVSTNGFQVELGSDSYHRVVEYIGDFYQFLVLDYQFLWCLNGQKSIALLTFKKLVKLEMGVLDPYFFELFRSNNLQLFLKFLRFLDKYSTLKPLIHLG